MQNVISNDEKRELERIYDILTMVECETSDIADDEGEYDMENIKSMCRYATEWAAKASNTLLAILHGHYDHDEHSLYGFELGK